MSTSDRREFLRRLAQAGFLTAAVRPAFVYGAAEATSGAPAVSFPGPWAFGLPKGAIILVSDQQLEDLQDPDREVNLSLSAVPQLTTLRKLCEQERARGSRTVILAFDHFFAQYRPGQAKRTLMPDMDEYIRRVAKMSETMRAHNLGLELSLLSPLELGPGYRQATGESGQWIQFREGLRDPSTGRYELTLWEHQRWTNNKGSVDVRRLGARAFAFREHRIGGTPFHAVTPSEVVELRQTPQLESWDGASVNIGNSFRARRLVVRGEGDTGIGPLDRVLVVIRYETPELDYFSPRAAPFLHDLVDRYHQAGIPLNGLYSDEMHIQQDWAYHQHHDVGQFTLRYLTPAFAQAYASAYGSEFADFERFLVYFTYAQHEFLPGLEARLPSQHVLGPTPEDKERTVLLRRRYYDLLARTVVGLFAEAKGYAERTYGHPLEARAHATWAQSPTIDSWDTGPLPLPPHQYEYTSNFTWANTVHQAAAACDDYFRWNDFLTGGGNDHTEGGWLDRDYYALALACSTGILNQVPYAYAAHWGMPAAVSERRQALVDAFGASASPPFQAIQNSEHRDSEVLMLYPISLVAAEERFGSWMTQYGYANYVTADRLLERGRVTEDGSIEMAGRHFRTLIALFEPVPPQGLLPFMRQFVRQGGRIVWSGPPARLDFSGAPILDSWRELFGVASLDFGHQGLPAPGEWIQFNGVLSGVPDQEILTHFLVDQLYPVTPKSTVESVARVGPRIVGLHHSFPGAGSATYLGFRPRDDQAASLGREARTWFEVLFKLGAYPPSILGSPLNDNPATMSRNSPYLACRFPNGTVTVAAHLHRYTESWPGGFQRNPDEDARILSSHPLPPDRLELREFAVAGLRLSYEGRLIVAVQPGPANALAAFGGYDCRRIQINGTTHEFADEPLAFLAWAPVAAERRVPGGALWELWIQGAGEVRVPLPSNTGVVRVFEAGPQPGTLGSPVPSALHENRLSLGAGSPGHLGHYYVVGG